MNYGKILGFYFVAMILSSVSAFAQTVHFNCKSEKDGLSAESLRVLEQFPRANAKGFATFKNDASGKLVADVQMDLALKDRGRDGNVRIVSVNAQNVEARRMELNGKDGIPYSGIVLLIPGKDTPFTDNSWVLINGPFLTRLMAHFPYAPWDQARSYKSRCGLVASSSSDQILDNQAIGIGAVDALSLIAPF